MKELDAGFAPGRLVALEDFERFIVKNIREAVGFRERPVVDEAVVTGSAFEIYPHEDLGNILRGLHGWNLAGIDHAAPNNSFAEAGRGVGWVHQFGHELVVRFVAVKRGEEPRGDLLAAAID